MLAVDPQITASQLLRIFHRDEPYLFLGAAFTTVAILAAAFSVLWRKVDSLAVYFALFAFLYGQRLWVQAGLLEALVPHSDILERLRSGIDFLVPIPAFLFFEAAGLLHRRARILGYILGILLGSLALVTFTFGPSPVYHQINNVVVDRRVDRAGDSIAAESRSQPGLCRNSPRPADLRGVRLVGQHRGRVQARLQD
jgi:sigma-B regulation protein RsbU (phosphoserine phosphatase)